jgi:ferrochelatase
VKRIDQTLARFPLFENVHLVFSAHSVPLSIIQGGDPYQMQIEKTVELVLQCGGWTHPYTVCYQSKVGASKWLQPSLRDTLRQLALQATGNVVVIPISFVSDHVETLGEIDHEAREQAHREGISRFEMMPGLNDSPDFINALAKLVFDRLFQARPGEHHGLQPAATHAPRHG